MFRNGPLPPSITSDWLVAGLNNIYQGSSPSSAIVWGNADTNNPSVDISNNYWGGLTPPALSPSYTTSWPGFNFTTSSGPSAYSSTSGITCSDEDDKAVHKPQSIKTMSLASGIDTCTTGFPDYVAELNSNFEWQIAYDTMRYWYIPHCYPIAEAQNTAGALDGSARIGVVMTTVDSLLNFRSFVIHCLTLRNDNEWFCSFVGALGGTYTDSNNIYNPDYRAARTIAKYLIDNPRCAYVANGDEFDYQQLLTTQHQIWVDSSAPGSKFDTTIPTMQQLGLDTVLEINAESDIVYPVQTSSIILDARLEGNPTADGGLLWLSIGREAYLHINVYDLLGRQLSGAGYQGVFEQGTREIPLGMANAPAGTYYVRVQTANNETQTLKLVKE